MLVRRGLSDEQAVRVNGFARGHPLALELAAGALRAQPDLDIAPGPPPRILGQLSTAFLAGLPPEVTSRARQVLLELEAASLQREDKPGTKPDQLQLFAPAPRSAVEEELRKLDINQLTPLEALSKLAELRHKTEN